LLNGQLGARRRCYSTPLGVAISNIGKLRTKKQMVGSHAARVVAAMKHTLPSGNLSVDEQPRDTMRTLPRTPAKP
jgi:hypothetical protein